MAITKPLIFTEIEITDAGGGTAAQFDKHLVESAEVTLEPAESMIDDGQTLTDYYDATFTVKLYEAGILADARVYTDASEEPVKADIIFKGATGVDDLTLAGTIINGNRDFSGNRTAAVVKGTKRGVSIDLIGVGA